jgi:cell division transport system permease protein
MAFVFRETWRAIRNAPMAWAMSAITLAVALSVAALFGAAAWKARTALREARESLPIEVFFAPDISDDDAQTILDRDFTQLHGIRSIALTTRKQALADYKKISGEDVERILGTNPLPASATIHIFDPTSQIVAETVERLRGMSGVADVRSDPGLLKMLEDRSHSLDQVAIIMGSLLLLTSIFFLIVTARLTIMARRPAVRVMRQLGAREWQIVLPVACEGASAGILAGIIAALVLVVLQKTSSALWEQYIDVPGHGMLPLSALIIVSGLLLGFLPSIGVAWAAGRGRHAARGSLQALQ